jgi:hypothetical protein
MMVLLGGGMCVVSSTSLWQQYVCATAPSSHVKLISRKISSSGQRAQSGKS